MILIVVLNHRSISITIMQTDSDSVIFIETFKLKVRKPYIEKILVLVFSLILGTTTSTSTSTSTSNTT